MGLACEMAGRLHNITTQLSAVPTANAYGKVGTKTNNDVVIVSALRTPIGKAGKAFGETTPDTLLKQLFEGMISQTGVDPAEMGEVTVGNVQLGGSYAGGARPAQLEAGFPFTVPLHSVNRQCSSGLQAVASVASAIAAGTIDSGIGAGVESMSLGGGVAPGSQKEKPKLQFDMEALKANATAFETLVPMGITSENVAERYGITREMQDEMAVSSNLKAIAAIEKGYFKNEIVPITTKNNGVVDTDQGPRKGTTLEGLAKLKPAFKKGGASHAGNSSQVCLFASVCAAKHFFRIPNLCLLAHDDFMAPFHPPFLRC